MAVDEYVTRPAAPALRGVVAPYTGYRQRGVRPAVHRGLPSPYVTVVFTLDEPLDIAAHADPSQTPGRYDALVGGLHTKPVLIRHEGAQSGVQVSVDPLWARRVFGLPGGELAGVDVHAADLLGPVAERILDRLRAAAGWDARFDVLDRALLGLLADDPQGSVPPEVRHVWTRLRGTGGLAPIGCLADETGWSDRHLAARFRCETGLTPKTAGRVIRFDRVRRAVQAVGAPSLADLAATHGYYDQSHLVRDFRELTGLAPTRWLAAEATEQGDLMDDKSVLDHIHDLVAEEKTLRAAGHTVSGDDRRRLEKIQHELDRTWDLLRQRRAHEEFDQDPDTATERTEDEVDRYLQ